MATGYVGLALLVLALAIGPWNVLRGRPNPVSTDLRRDVGIWGGILSLTHVVIGLQVHMAGKLWLYFVYPPDQPHVLPVRYDLFGFANYTGLGTTIILLLLLTLSNDISLRWLGAGRWKALQRWNYTGFVLLIFHGFAYQVLEKRTLGLVSLFAGMVLVVWVMQSLGYFKIRNPGFPSLSEPSQAGQQ
jgi:sulfoxide reductase heme-binding subunit YedZ